VRPTVGSWLHSLLMKYSRISWEIGWCKEGEALFRRPPYLFASRGGSLVLGIDSSGGINSAMKLIPPV
jgi:hypothetical protein